MTLALAGFAAGLRPGAVPGWVASRIRLHIMDSIGCGVAGAATGLAAQARRFVAMENGPGPCVLIGTGATAPPAAAAFANAVAMNALDFDDGLEVGGRGMGHPGATIVPAALSACAGRRVSGAAFLCAVAAGYEANARIIVSMQPSIERFREVYGVCQHQVVGAAVAYGVLLGLDAAALENTMGLAGTLAHVPSLHCYNWQERPLMSFKDFNGPAAQGGVAAAGMHAVGMVGARDVLGAPSGLWRMLGSDRFDPAVLTGGLGEQWLIGQSSLKPYPACRWMHTTLEAFETVCAAEGWDAAAIERVVVHASAGLARDFMDRCPVTMVDAQFSLPYTLAALAHGIPRARWYDTAALSDPLLLGFARRVEAVIDPEVDALMTGERRPAGRVAVTAGGETRRSRLISWPLGGPERPLDAGQIEAKALANAAAVLGPERAEALVARLARLEAEADMAALMAATRPKPGKSSHHEGPHQCRSRPR